MQGTKMVRKRRTSSNARSISLPEAQVAEEFTLTQQAKLNRGSINNRLGVQLSQWIKNETQDQTFAAVPVSDRSGYSMFIWRDDEGAKLLLENLPREGNVAAPDEIGTARAIQKQAKNAGLKSIPPTIIIHTPDDPVQKMSAKKLLLDYIRSLPTPATPRATTVTYVLQETASLPLNNNKEVAIKFSVKTVMATPVFTPMEFIAEMGEGPGQDVKLFGKTVRSVSTLYKALLDALGEFHTKLADMDIPAEGDAQEVKNTKKAALDDSTQKLEQAINNYIHGSTTTDEKAKQKKLAAAGTLLARLQVAKSKNFADELDRNRRKRWDKLNPLTDDQIIPGTEKSVGSGAQGEVFRYNFQRADNLHPAVFTTFDAVVKYDDNTYLNQNAVAAGIPGNYPQQSLRAIAAYTLSFRNGLDVIPETVQFMHTDNDGHARLGQAQEYVQGSVGQRKVALRNDPVNPETKQRLDELQAAIQGGDRAARDTAIKAYEAYNVYYDVHGTKNYFPKEPISVDQKARLNGLVAKKSSGQPLSIPEQQALDTFVVNNNGDWFHAVNRPININYRLPAVQKGLADLQLFDYIIGHADRNPANWMYVKVGNTIIGVVGIDNDDSFGQAWKAKGSTEDPTEESKTPEVPPVVDLDTAIKILTMNLDSSNALAGLSADEIAAAKNRLVHVQGVIRDRAKAKGGVIAVLTSVPQNERLAQMETLRELVNGKGGAPLAALRNWGSDEVTGLHYENNSYLGSQVAQAGANNVNAVPEPNKNDNTFVIAAPPRLAPPQ
ncbi:MAG: hypothetical protein NVSMB49_16790 [Ktedonobacteraceae bacterium]